MTNPFDLHKRERERVRRRPPDEIKKKKDSKNRGEDWKRRRSPFNVGSRFEKLRVFDTVVADRSVIARHGDDTGKSVGQRTIGDNLLL